MPISPFDDDFLDSLFEVPLKGGLLSEFQALLLEQRDELAASISASPDMEELEEEHLLSLFADVAAHCDTPVIKASGLTPHALQQLLVSREENSFAPVVQGDFAMCMAVQENKTEDYKQRLSHFYALLLANAEADAGYLKEDQKTDLLMVYAASLDALESNLKLAYARQSTVIPLLQHQLEEARQFIHSTVGVIYKIDNAAPQGKREIQEKVADARATLATLKVSAA